MHVPKIGAPANSLWFISGIGIPELTYYDRQRLGAPCHLLMISGVAAAAARPNDGHRPPYAVGASGREIRLN